MLLVSGRTLMDTNEETNWDFCDEVMVFHMYSGVWRYNLGRQIKTIGRQSQKMSTFIHAV